MDTIKKIIVHSGCFHADDAMCAAIARVINPDVIIERAAKAPETVPDGTVVADLGGGKYDHHQGGKIRESGTEYAACGLLLEDCWPLIFPTEDDYLHFVNNFIIPIELQDNGVQQNPLSMAISGFTPSWDSRESMDEAFLKAVDLLQTILENAVEHAESRIRGQKTVEDALNKSDGSVVVLDRFAPWQNVLIRSTAGFVVFPSNRGGYNLQVVPESGGRFAPAKQPLPESWLENRPDGCTFVHTGLFLASFKTKDQAVAAAESLLITEGDAL